jgi:hypothetical protein
LPTNILYAFLFSPIRATCAPHLILLDLVNGYGSFGETCCLHSQDSLLFSEDGGSVSPKRSYRSIEPHGVTYRETVIL